MDQDRRPSVYLEERCANLDQVLDFFLSAQRGRGVGLDEMLVVFLSQLGFWEWELDNLIYAFATFEERAKAWQHENGFGIANALRNQGIRVRRVAVKDLKFKRQTRAGRPAVYAPVRNLNKVIRKWNELVCLCEEKVLIPPEDRRAEAELGAQVLQDLGKHCKPLLDERGETA